MEERNQDFVLEGIGGEHHSSGKGCQRAEPLEAGRFLLCFDEINLLVTLFMIFGIFSVQVAWLRGGPQPLAPRSGCALGCVKMTLKIKIIFVPDLTC